MKEITTVTTYDKDKIKKFLNYYYFDKIKYIRIIINILILFMIIYFFRKDDITSFDIIVFAFAMFGILEVNTSIIPSFNYYKLTKKKNNVINSKLKYTFKKNNFKLTTDKDEYINYKDLKKVVEKDSAYYLYINNSRAFIVDKNNLSEEEIKNLSNLFSEQVSTYICKK